MTDTTTQTTQTTATTTTPAATNAPAATATPATDAGTSQNNSNTAPDGAVKTEPSSSTAAPDGAAPAADKAQATNSDAADKAQGGDGTDKSKPDGQSSEGEKPKDGEAKEGEDTALAYQPSDFVMPEGMELDAEAFEAAAPVLKSNNVPKEAVQQLVDVAANMVSKAVKTATDAHLKQVDTWGNQTREEFGKGGEAAFEKETATAQAAINRFFSDEEKQQLQHYGFGNFPAVFRMAHVLGTMMQEDNPHLPSTPGAKKEETLADVWYPQKQS